MKRKHRALPLPERAHGKTAFPLLIQYGKRHRIIASNALRITTACQLRLLRSHWEEDVGEVDCPHCQRVVNRGLMIKKEAAA